ncbi:hypothetical protein RHO12_01065 [Orbus sturtevantii]|uniref:hypothetical protein n=1 Tax=Orbus sturtevantii TaxID=3074109 RepID=UPI00370D1A4A
MDIAEIIIKSGSLAAAIGGSLTLLTNSFTFFDAYLPSSRKLSKFVKYKKEYSALYPEFINEWLTNQIRYLSLMKLTKIRKKVNQLVYFRIVKGLSNKDMPRNLLCKIITYSCIHNDGTIEPDKRQLKDFNLRTSKKWLSWWLIGFITYLIASIFLSLNFYFNFFEIRSSSSMTSFWIAILIWNIVFYGILFFSKIPLIRKEFDDAVGAINDWNKDIIEQLEKNNIKE